METTIIDESNIFKLYGLSKRHDPNQPYYTTIAELLDQVWQEVRQKELPHTGISHVLYEAENVVFAGVVLQSAEEPDTALEKKEVVLRKYAYCKHIGPYNQLDNTHKHIRSAIQARGEQHEAPTLEVYGHGHEDETKLETEIFYNLK